MVVFGGKFDVSVAYSLNLEAMEWQKLQNVYYRRMMHTANSTKEFVYLIGGWLFDNQQAQIFNDVQQYDFSKGTLLEIPTTGTKPSPRSQHRCIIIDDIIYLFGG